MNAKRLLHPLDGRGQRNIKCIYWHYSDSDDVSMDTIRQWHQAKGWVREGYHFLIRKNGMIEVGRPESMVGAHCQGHNTNSLGICLCGSDKLSWYPAEVQYHSAGLLGRNLKDKYGLSLEAATKFHRDDYSTDCPGRLDRGYLKQAIMDYQPIVINTHKEDVEMSLIVSPKPVTELPICVYIGNLNGVNWDCVCKAENPNAKNVTVNIKAITNTVIGPDNGKGYNMQLGQNKSGEVRASADLKMAGAGWIIISCPDPVNMGFEYRPF